MTRSAAMGVRGPASRGASLRGFARLHKIVTYAIAALGLGGLALGGEVDLPSMALLVAAFVATWWVEGERLVDPRWSRGATVALLVLLVVQLVRGLLGEPALGLALGFSGALQAARLASRRTAREHLQIALLAFLHLCAATVLSTRITYGLVFFGFLLVVPWMLALTHLRDEIETQHAARRREARDAERAPEGDRITLAPDDERTQLERVLASRDLVGPSFLVGTALLAIPLFVVTAVLFTLFPRVGLGMLSFGSDPGRSMAGFGSEVELGQVGRIRDDDTVVMRVVPPGLTDDPPRVAALRLRGTSFDHYDGRRWSRSHAEAGRPLRDLFDDYAITRTPRPEIDAPYEITLDHLDQTVVFLPEHTVGLRIPPRSRNGVDEHRAIVLYPGLDIRYEDGDALGLRYTAYVSTEPNLEPLRGLTPDDRRRYLQLPSGHERVVTLAHAWTDGARSERERAERILAQLHGPAFSYSLDMRDPEGRPPIERFLFDWRSGHCEYYASAMVLLLRAEGVPARNVTGFLGAEWNEYGRYYAVRSRDAHAWVEAYLPGEGWVTFDPTPAGRGLGFTDSFFAELRALSDAAVVWWERRVVGFDLGSQRRIAVDAWRWLRELRGSAASSASSVDDRAERPRAVPGSLVALVLVGGVVAFAVWMRRRRRLTADALPARTQRVIALYRRLEAALVLHGVPRPPSRTPAEHARALAETGLPGATLVLEVTARYNAARFGDEPIDEGDLARLETAIDAWARSTT